MGKRKFFNWGERKERELKGKKRQLPRGVGIMVGEKTRLDHVAVLPPTWVDTSFCLPSVNVGIRQI
jgi:hypothetical protein